jgi:hypothetical protein
VATTSKKTSAFFAAKALTENQFNLACSSALTVARSRKILESRKTIAEYPFVALGSLPGVANTMHGSLTSSKIIDD